ncbi:protein suppressor 2 of zeste [Anopheles marshallii]|uniref:protein suppressor 2 of zeste n=1 Tax=Anopheles marshallii TaxID=1521116 RepID=UPI00237A3A54|nr:protein suppressor 2 of zeste [Anopheles marshallii]
MTSAAAMISGSGGGGVEGGTAIRPSLKDSRASLVPTPENAGSTRHSSTRSPSSSYASTSPALPMAGMMMHEPERIRMRGSAAGNNRRRVKDFNDSITCTLCNGYLVEATSVNDCLHAFCRSCIVKYLECNKYCPRCKSYNSKPITVANLRPDRTLRALVYKLVPGLHKSENQRIVQFYASISSNIVPSVEDDPTGQGTFQLLDDQNFFSPDEPISLSLEYHYDAVAEHGGASSGQLPITYLQCPAAVTVHHLYKFILTKNGLQVGSDNIRVEIIYEEEILPHDYTLMDVAYCFDYKRIAPMRFFYRILIHSTAKLAPTASAYHRVEGQDKNSTNSSNSGSPDTTGPANPGKSSAGSGTPTVKTTPTTAGVNDGQRPGSTKTKAVQGSGGSKHQPAGRAPREETANNSAPMAAVNGHHRTKSSTTATKPTSSEVVRGTAQSSSPVVTSTSSTGLKMVLVPKGKHETNAAGTAEAKRSPPPLKAIQSASAVPQNGGAAALKQSSKEPTATGKEATTPTVETEKSTLKCYVNLKTQTVVGAPSSLESVPSKACESEPPKQPPAEIPRLKIDLKAKLSIPREKHPGLSPPSSSNSSAATSPSSATSATSSAGKSPVWPMGKEEYAKTIGLKPVYASSVVPEVGLDESSSHSSSHRKRKKGKHSKEAGSSGKRRKLHAEISSQHDASLKMKVKLTEKPPKHERLKSSGNEEEPAQPKSPRVVVQEPVPSPPKPPKVIDITKDDDEVKFVAEQKPTNVKSPPVPTAIVPKDIPVSAPASSTSTTSKEKLNEMRSVRHKPMVYIPNLDRNLSADVAGVGSSINSLLESVGAKTPLLKPTPALIPTSTASSALAGKSQPRTPILSRPMPSCPPLAYPIASSPVTSSTTGSIRTMAAPPAIKRSITTDSGNGAAAKVPRLEPPSLMPPVSLLPAKQPAPIQAPMFNFAKGANRAKAAQQAAGMAPTQPEHVPYRSPISASYTKEIPSTKKPIPNLLLPPATVSVTKMSDIVSSTLSPSPLQDNGRPAVEFLRIPSNAPVADKPMLAPFTTPKVSTKTTRPPPATIPLIKIKKPTVLGSNGVESVQGGVIPPSMTPLTPPMRPKVPVRSASDPMAGSNTNILDLSGGGVTANRRLSDDVIILDHSPAKSISDTTNRSRVVDSNRGKPSSTGLHFSPVKRSPEMLNFSAPTSTSALLSQALPPVQKTLAPLPKLTEINRHRSLTVRQPNASIRSIPNPSALAFRGAQSGVATTIPNTPSSTTMGMLMAGFSAPPNQQSNGNLTGSNRANSNAISASMTCSSTTIKANTASLSNGSARQEQLTPMMGITSGNATVKGTSTNGNADPKPPHNGANGNTTHNNNNNNSKIANANTGLLAAKKKIETVAAVLKAAAATADTTSQRSTAATTTKSSTSTTTTGGMREESKGKPQKEDTTPHPSAAVTAASSTTTAGSGDSLSMVTVSAVNRAVNNKTHADSIVTSVTTASIASVTGTSSRNSPASIVNVG